VADPGLGVVDGGGDLGAVVVFSDADLGGDEEFVRAEVDGAQVDDPVDARFGEQRGVDLVDRLAGGGLADEQALDLGGQHGRDGDEERADGEGGDAVEDAVAGGQGEADPGQGEQQAEQRAGVFQQDDGRFGGAGVADELNPALPAADPVGCLDGGAQRVARAIATSSTATATSGARSSCGSVTFA
jgi:hypothetical protein